MDSIFHFGKGGTDGERAMASAMETMMAGKRRGSERQVGQWRGHEYNQDEGRTVSVGTDTVRLKTVKDRRAKT